MYDPFYDPFPNPQSSYPQSYWAANTETDEYAPLSGEHAADVAVIGGGYTGLSAAYHLAEKYGASVAVLEAARAGWGCSGRNAGFVLAGTGRLSMAQMQQKWGETTADAIYREYLTSVDTVNRLIAKGNIECDKTTGGYIKLAHKPSFAEALQRQTELLRDRFSEPVEFIEPSSVAEQFVAGTKSFGGIYYPHTFAINPLKLANGYAQLATASGAKVFCQSPVIDWQKDGRRQVLKTPTGHLSCEKVIIASNGYTARHLHKSVENRHFPVVSSVIVTRPLSDSERASIGIKAGLMAMDTRSLKYYYRLLPDQRLLFGGRGAIEGKHADDDKYRQRLLQGLVQTFPALRGITADYFWSGWVSVSYDDYPRVIYHRQQRTGYAMGYCGSGLAFATQAGKRLAQQLAKDKDIPDLPFWQSDLPRFPFAPMRRVGLRGFYLWQQLFG